ncbi:pyridoxamine 5'-phosphate oxidase-domain-containing protein [Phanerochaete sordida]|uniref:Pyridoxamine 5'-phosphate oxidase-domain-containing protein n=1 Tax=Phanerochaete sordida TaxID=48140 RepID=A0A9P3LMX6_9APHY|nr:pyridoxamine 5'-phosphate oxidase-domain-containing protein [Phanerochaete sordida]
MATPRWVKAIKDALAVPENKGKIVYQVASVDSHNIPHVRTQVHRGFLIPKRAPQVPLLVSSSDVRAPKVVQMLSNTTVELCWWMEGSSDQFRIQAKAHVVTPPDHALRGVSSQLPSVRALDEGGEEREDNETLLEKGGKYDWEKKRRETFEAMKPPMKASWCVPHAPGSRMASYDTPTREQWPTEVPDFADLKTDQDKKNYEFALSNFAMVVFEPTRVDWVQLGESPNRRTLFTRTDFAGGMEWEEQILVP